MKQVHIEVLKFLVSGKAYSTEAIIKNLGIEEEELKTIYSELKNLGYLETYSEYEEREGKNSNCHSSNCTNCESGCSQENEFDKTKVLVLTAKTLSEFN